MFPCLKTKLELHRYIENIANKLCNLCIYAVFISQVISLSIHYQNLVFIRNRKGFYFAIQSFILVKT